MATASASKYVILVSSKRRTQNRFKVFQPTFFFHQEMLIVKMKILSKNCVNKTLSPLSEYLRNICFLRNQSTPKPMSMPLFCQILQHPQSNRHCNHLVAQRVYRDCLTQHTIKHRCRNTRFCANTIELLQHAG